MTSPSSRVSISKMSGTSMPRMLNCPVTWVVTTSPAVNPSGRGRASSRVKTAIGSLGNIRLRTYWSRRDWSLLSCWRSILMTDDRPSRWNLTRECRRPHDRIAGQWEVIQLLPYGEGSFGTFADEKGDALVLPYRSLRVKRRGWGCDRGRSWDSSCSWSSRRLRLGRRWCKGRGGLRRRCYRGRGRRFWR